jgi:hypothetical protein
VIQAVFEAGLILEPGQEPTEARIQIFRGFFLFFFPRDPGSFGPSDSVYETGKTLIGGFIEKTPDQALLEQEVVDELGAPDILLDVLNGPL